MGIQHWLLAGMTIVSFGAVSSQAIAQTTSKTTERQQTKAELSYNVDKERSFLSNFQVKIQRQGKTLVDAALPLDQLPNSSSDHTLNAIGADIQAIDFDNDGESEVIVDIAEAGARCCSFSVIYGYNKRTQQYQSLTHFWGNYTSGYWMEGISGKAGDRSLSDLNKDGNSEFIALDDRFRGEFGAFVVSAAPVQIWRYQNNRLVDVTRKFPQQVRESARSAWRQYESLRKEHNPQTAKGAMAAYVGAKILLGEREDAIKRLQVGYPKDSTFRSDLLRFLRKTGYLRQSDRL